MSGLEQLLPFVLIFLAFWLLLIRPQRRRQQELARTQGAVQIGDEVLLSAGIAGRVAGSDDEFLQLEISPGVHMKVARQAVVRVLTEIPDSPAGLDDADDEPGYDAGYDSGHEGHPEGHPDDRPGDQGGEPGRPGSH